MGLNAYNAKEIVCGPENISTLEAAVIAVCFQSRRGAMSILMQTFEHKPFSWRQQNTH